MSEWKGEGWYRVGWSDGGMDWTNNGPNWYDSERELEDEMFFANQNATDTHIPYAEYLGDGDEPEDEQSDTFEEIIRDAFMAGYTDPDNERIEQLLVKRCKDLAQSLAKEDK